MDEQPKCSHDIEPITQQPKQKDRSAAQEDQTAQKEETLVTKIQTVLTKESPANLEDLSTTPKTVLAIDQTIYSIDQPALLKDQSAYSKEELAHPKDQSATFSKLSQLKDQPAAYSKLAHPKDQPAAYSKIQNALTEDQLAAYSKIQNVLTEDQPATYSKNQRANSKSLNALTIDQPAVTKEETSFPKIHIASRKIKSSSSEEQTATSTIHICSTKDESSSSKEQTFSTKDRNSVSLRKLTITPKIQIASTRDEVATTVTTKNIVDTLIEDYSKKIESGISLCPARASATPSFNINNGYSSKAPLKISSATQSPITTQPVSQLPLAASVAVINQPPSLFLQALSKLNESSLTLAVISHFRLRSSSNLSKVYKIESGEITPPDSLTSAPPTYSFVLRQLAVRRRPRFMGTFFPSPSFIQQSPPPTYTGAFDVYIEPALPPAPARVYTFGFTSMPIVCPECGYTGMTVVTSHVTICTHLCAFILCLLCCWICAPLPYILRSCKDVYHYCRNCRSFLGMYCPTNPETAAYPNLT